MTPDPLQCEFLPAADRSSKRLMVVLHGLGDSSRGYDWLPGMLGIPWMNFLLVNAPDPYYTGFSWYDFGGSPAPGIERSRRLLGSLLDEQRAGGFPTEETTLFGFSQGCLMTLETGLRYPHRFAGLVGVSGYLHDPERLLAEAPAVAREQRILMTHGTLDPLVPIAPVRIQAQQLRAAGWRLEWREFQKAHTIDGETELALIRRFIRDGYPA